MQYLFKSGKINQLELRNRIVMAQMGARGLVEPDGRFSRRAIDYYTSRTKGGVGLIITGLMARILKSRKGLQTLGVQWPGPIQPPTLRG